MYDFEIDTRYLHPHARRLVHESLTFACGDKAPGGAEALAIEWLQLASAAIWLASVDRPKEWTRPILTTKR